MNKHEPSIPTPNSGVWMQCMLYIYIYILEEQRGAKSRVRMIGLNTCIAWHLQSSLLEFGGKHSHELRIRICEVGKASSSFNLGHLLKTLRHCWIPFFCCSILHPYCLTRIFFNSLKLGFEYFLKIFPGFCPQPSLARTKHHPQHIAIPFLHFHMISMIFFVFVCSCSSRIGLLNIVIWLGNAFNLWGLWKLDTCRALTKSRT